MTWFVFETVYNTHQLMHCIHYYQLFRRQQRRFRSSTLRRVPNPETMLRRCLKLLFGEFWREEKRRALAERQLVAVTSSKSQLRHTKRLQGKEVAAPRRLTEHYREIFTSYYIFFDPCKSCNVYCMTMCTASNPSQ